jgi:hypothetical protein
MHGRQHSPQPPKKNNLALAHDANQLVRGLVRIPAARQFNLKPLKESLARKLGSDQGPPKSKQDCGCTMRASLPLEERRPEDADADAGGYSRFLGLDWTQNWGSETLMC